MSDPRPFRLAAHKLAGDFEKADRASLEADMHEAGVSQMRAELPDGRKVATISRVEGDPKVTVVGPAFFEAWATNAEHPHPEAFVERVVPASIEYDPAPDFLASLVNRCGEAYTPEGEVVPGVRFVRGKAHLMVTASSAQKSLLLGAIRRREIDAADMLALPAPEED